MSTKRKIRVAVVGAGPAGQAHAFGLRNASMAERLAGVDVELATIVDPNTKLAEQVARRYGFAAVAADVSEIEADPSIDVVTVALPSFLSVPVVGGLLRAGKHVLTEKPLGRNGSESTQLRDIAAATDRVAAVGFSYRRLPAIADIREAVDGGLIGTPYFATAHFLADYALDPTIPGTWRFDQETSGGGVIVDMGTHAIDALEYVLGPVSEVLSATFDTVITERPTAAGGTAPVTNDDTLTLSLRLANNIPATLLASRVAAGATIDFGFEIYGSQGHLKFSFPHLNEFTLYRRDPSDERGNGPVVVQAGLDSRHFVDTMPMAARGNSTGYGEAFIAEMQDFLAAVVLDEPVDTTFAAAAQTMRVVNAAFESARTAAPVTINED